MSQHVCLETKESAQQTEQLSQTLCDLFNTLLVALLSDKGLSIPQILQQYDFVERKKEKQDDREFWQ